MKKLSILLAVMLLASSIGYCASGYAKAYTQDLSTKAVNNTSSGRTDFVCLVSSANPYSEISVIQVTVNSSATAQTVTLYDNGNLAPASATALWVCEIPVGQITPITIVFPSDKPLMATRGIVARKSDPASNVRLNLLRR